MEKSEIYFLIKQLVFFGMAHNIVQKTFSEIWNKTQKRRDLVSNLISPWKVGSVINTKQGMNIKVQKSDWTRESNTWSLTYEAASLPPEP